MTKTRHAAIFIAGAVLLLAGCGGGEPATGEPVQDTSAASESGDDAAASKREDVLGASMHDALDKAEAVEGKIMQQKKDIDAALDAAEGNDE